MSVRLRPLALLFVLPLLLLGHGLVPETAEGASTWAPTSTATIRPGVQMYTAGAQCTANFVFTDAARNVYVGYAAHCASKGSSSEINGCTTPSYPIGTAVTFRKGGNFFSDGTQVGRGTLAYSSWVTMQRRHVTNAARCVWNDFALVKVSTADRGKVNPTVPTWGGPSGLSSTPMAAGAKLYSLGNSSLRFGSGFGSPKTATVVRRAGGGLGYEIKGGTGIPGDSGAGYMDGLGRARGVLSTISVGLGITPVTNTIGDLYYELAWAQAYSGIKGLTLVKGTVPFHS